jgi:ribulose-5-phosphate 4-epimerase/fuculose-1-phosphate aldolase
MRQMPEIDLAPPTASPPHDERLRRKQHLAAAFRIFARLGFDDGAAGHVTARDPEHADRFWVNPLGMHFARIRVSDLILVDDHGQVVEGDGAVNLAAFTIHANVHRARPDVAAAAHAHSIFGKTWSSLGRLLDPITQDACAFYEDHALFDEQTGVVVRNEDGARIAAALGRRKAIILQNHGLLTVGETVDEATWWFIAMERCCQSQLLAEAAGTPIPIERRMARATYLQVGTPDVGRFNFQPLWQEIRATEPDLLE